MTGLTRFQALYPEPQHKDRYSWDQIEAQLGHGLPADYKAFADYYGSVYLGEFSLIRAPEPDHPRGPLPDMTGQARAYATLASHQPYKYHMPAYPAEGSLAAWGRTENGDWLCWIMTGSPEAWQVAVLQDEEGMPLVYDMGFMDFILALARGDLRPEAYPEDVFDVLPMSLESL